VAVRLPDGTRLTVTRTGARWKSVPAAWESARDARGAVLVRVPVGAGAVVVLLDDFALTNSGLDADANPAAIAALLGRELHGGSLIFDEARHGFGRAHSYLGVLLALPGAPLAAALCLLLAAIWLHGQNLRMRAPEIWRPRERRTAREYVEALAELHARARSAPLMVEALAQRLAPLARRQGRSDPELERAIAGAREFRRQALRERVPQRAAATMRALAQARQRSFGHQRSAG
jgi:hypothetical protein